MAKSFKIKLFAVIFALTVLILSVAAASVSYAKWTGDYSGVGAAGTIGSWKDGESTDVGVVSIRPIGDASISIDSDSYDTQGTDGSIFSVEITVLAGGSFELYVGGKKISYDVQGDSYIRKNPDGTYTSTAPVEMKFLVSYNAELQAIWFY